MKEDKNSFCTNMKKDDPLIEKFMKEYLQEKTSSENVERCDDLVVNFDITYADGENENYTCGSISKPFGRGENGDSESKEECTKPKENDSEEDDSEDNNDDDYNEFMSRECYGQNKKEDYYNESMNEDCYHENQEENYYNNSQNKNYYDIEDCYNEQYNLSEKERWENCEQEYHEYDRNKKCCEEEKAKSIKGMITVISTLSSINGIRLKGVKINLYRLNGISPQLVDCKITDCEGKVIFMNLPEGSYRIIEIMDKRYFEKPCYMKWNEVTIDECNTSDTIYAINNIKNCIRHR